MALSITFPPLNENVIHWIRSFGPAAPWVCLGLFLAGSLLMLWRLESMSDAGVEGTVLGTLVMPYCSGLGNLIFAFVLGRSGGNGQEVLTNCLVNNVTNLTLLIGLPAMVWGLSLASKKSAKPKKGKAGGEDKQRLHRLSLLFTMLAAVFFTGTLWALGRDGIIDFTDGMVLIGIFLFWQVFHVYEVLKANVQQRVFGVMLILNLALLVAGAYAVYISTDWLVSWVQSSPAGFISGKNLGWLSGWLMVLPNALLAFYFAARHRAEVVYTSQIGDGHICIPLCVGVFALFKPVPIPEFFLLGVWILLGAIAVHFFFVAVFAKLPRLIGVLLVVGYAVFLWKGFGR